MSRRQINIQYLRKKYVAYKNNPVTLTGFMLCLNIAAKFRSVK